MKIKIIIGVLLITLMVPIVYAENATNSDQKTDDIKLETSPGVLPDSPFYGLERAIEKLQIAFARGSVKKAELRIKFAKERQAEFKVMSEKGKIDKAKKALEDYDNDMADADKNVEDARGIGKNVSQLVKEVDNVHEKHLLVLQLVRAKAPEQAKKGLDRAIENAQKKPGKKSADKEKKKPENENNKEKVEPKSKNNKENQNHKHSKSLEYILSDYCISGKTCELECGSNSDCLLMTCGGFSFAVHKGAVENLDNDKIIRNWCSEASEITKSAEQNVYCNNYKKCALT